MKKLFLILFFYSTSISQWQLSWSSSAISGSATTGWLNFEKIGNTWQGRMYLIDSVKFQIMSSAFSNTPEYTYNFSAGEIFAGGEVYSTGYDLTSDGKIDFYSLASYGTTTNYRSSFKVFNIVTGTTIFEKNEANFSYSYPIFSDVDGDGTIECVAIKYDFPYANKYYYEIYKTGITGVSDETRPDGFRLNQNFPNPFNGSTVISYRLKSSSFVNLKVYDLLGNEISTLANEKKPAGENKTYFNSNNLPTGFYIYKLNVDGKSSYKKMLLVK